MADAAETLNDGAAPARRRTRPVRRRWAHALWSGVVGLLMLVFVTLGLAAVMGRTLTAPDWLRADLALRVESAVGGTLDFTFGDIALVVGEGWRPRIHLTDLLLRQADGQQMLQLADAEVTLSVSALMQGQIRPKTVLVTGVFATLRKDADGALALSLGDQGQPVEEAQSFPQLIESWDVALKEPILSQLTTLDLQALTLRYEDAQAGRGWTVDGGRVLAERDGDDLRLSGTFSLLSGRDYAATVEANYASRIGDLAAEFGVSVTDLAAEDAATQSVALRWLEVLRAPISGAFRGGIDSDGALGPVHATLQIGAGVLQPTEATKPIPFQQARTYFTYAPGDQSLSFDEISVVSSWGEGVAEGTAYLNGVDTGQVTDLVGQFQLSDFRLNPAGLYPAPLEVAAATADFRLDLDPFHLKLGQLQVADGESSLLVSGDLRAGATGWDVAVNSRMDQITPDRLLQIWPAPLAPKPRKWVEDNLFAATLHGIDFSLRTVPGTKPDLYLDFDFADAVVRFAKWLPPLTGGAGTVTLVDKRFVATASAGVVDSGVHGVLDATGTSFIIPDTDAKPNGPGIARVQAEGPIAAVMALLNRPPASILKNSTLPEDLAQGHVRAVGTLAMPLRKGAQFEEAQFHVSGDVTGVDSTVLVPGHRITADQLQIDVTHKRVVLSGPGQISSIPAQVVWRQPIGPGAPKASTLTGTVELSPRTVEAFKIGLPPGSVSGLGEGQIEIDLAEGRAPQMRLRSDLRGVGLSMPPLGWAKSAGSTGTLEVAARLGASPEVTRLALNAAGLRAEGGVTLRADGGLNRASFSSVRLGGWLSAPVDIVGQGKGRPVAVQIGGGRLDMGKARFGPSGGESGPMQVALDRLQITEQIYLDKFRGSFVGGKGLRGTFSGLLGGRTPVTGEVEPQSGRSAFRILSQDAGGVLRDAGLLTQARGGEFQMTLTPGERAGDFRGAAQVRNIRVINAPAVAALLDAASIVGLIDELAGPGIQFAQGDARFLLSPEKVVLYEGSVTGPSMGLSMDGSYDIVADRLGMQGVISPLYLINGIGSVLTRRGEGLIGFNYTLRGSASNPKVQVNPLSALAPGMLREALRPPPPTDPQAPEPGTSRTNYSTHNPTDGPAEGR